MVFDASSDVNSVNSINNDLDDILDEFDNLEGPHFPTRDDQKYQSIEMDIYLDSLVYLSHTSLNTSELYLTLWHLWGSVCLPVICQKHRLSPFFHFGIVGLSAICSSSNSTQKSQHKMSHCVKSYADHGTNETIPPGQPHRT